jgi:hypothetical protein
MKKQRNGSFILFIFLSIFLILSGCGGGGGGPTGSTGDDTGQNPTPVTPSAPAFAGFDFTLKQGDFWEYGWDYDKNYWDSFSGGSRTTDSGTFRLALGAPKEISGVTAFEIIVTGYSGSSEWGFKPRWKYISLDENKILGSEDGLTLFTLFDAQTGSWPGSGFFTTFSATTLCDGSSGTLNNAYVSCPAVVIGESTNKEQCQYFSGYGTICGGDLDETLQRREYYGERIGPLGYYSYSAISDMTSQYPWSSSTTKNVGLLKSSLRGETVNYDFESEPNDSPATAQTMTFGWSIQGLVRYEDRDQSTTIALNEVQETEPNDSRIAPQALGFPAYVEGSANQTDLFSSFQFWYQSVWYTINAEDWYTFTLSAPTQLTIELAFLGSTTADLDLYLFLSSSNTPLIYSINDNVALGSFSESIQVPAPLAAGTYIIAVDAYLTPGGSVPYSLDISETSKRNEVTVEDWYSITLAAQATVSISLDFEDSRSNLDLYLFDQTGGTLLASSRNDVGLPEDITITLAAGTYRVGVDLLNQWNTKYSLLFQ